MKCNWIELRNDTTKSSGGQSLAKWPKETVTESVNSAAETVIERWSQNNRTWCGGGVNKHDNDEDDDGDDNDGGAAAAAHEE